MWESGEPGPTGSTEITRLLTMLISSLWAGNKLRIYSFEEAALCVLAFLASLVSICEHKDLCVHTLGPINIVVHGVYSRVKMLLTICWFVDGKSSTLCRNCCTIRVTQQRDSFLPISDLNTLCPLIKTRVVSSTVDSYYLNLVGDLQQVAIVYIF